MSDRVIIQMADLFGYDVDFGLDIREGDSFTVLFEEQYLDGEKYRDGEIIAAEFVNQGRTIQAYRFVDEEGRSKYYSPDGRSMRKAFLRSPMEFARISSRFTKRRWHPVLKKWRAHKGVDYAAPTGTPIRSTGEGRVSRIGWMGGYGKAIMIQHGKTYTTVYGHMSRFAARHEERKPRIPGPNHWLRRENGLCDRAAPALRVPRQRGPQESLDGTAADGRADSSQVRGRVQARRQGSERSARTASPGSSSHKPTRPGRPARFLGASFPTFSDHQGAVPHPWGAGRQTHGKRQRASDLTGTTLYVGLISGTSADGVDAALIACHGDTVELLDSVFVPMPKELRRDILALCRPGDDEIRRVGALECQLADLFAESALRVAGERRDSIRAIGSHGQTIRHHADEPLPFTVQIGDPSRVAELTGITVVADFRRRDIAAGGQGAPLAPAFHRALFSAPEPRAVLNLGGMANLTLLPTGGPILGFDTGPGNALLDFWAERHTGEARDEGGRWAASGQTDPSLLASFLRDPYFSLAPPKSTGRERFHGAWLEAHLAECGTQPSATDVQATLAALTATSICDALLRYAPGHAATAGLRRGRAQRGRDVGTGLRAYRPFKSIPPDRSASTRTWSRPSDSRGWPTRRCTGSPATCRK